MPAGSESPGGGAMKASRQKKAKVATRYGARFGVPADPPKGNRPAGRGAGRGR